MHKENKAMSNSSHSDPAERRPLLRLFYRDWRPTRIGRWITRFTNWLTVLGLSPKTMATLEVRGRTSGRPRSTPVVIATVAGKSYLVSMLGPDSDWVKNVEAAQGAAVLHQGRRRRSVHLVPVPPDERAPILAEYVRVATSGRHHIPVAVGAPLSEFQAVAERYPVYQIDPA
jgi:deazaflavin-dependent oxidoreductase (nitroreductase family)